MRTVEAEARKSVHRQQGATLGLTEQSMMEIIHAKTKVHPLQHGGTLRNISNVYFKQAFVLRREPDSDCAQLWHFHFMGAREISWWCLLAGDRSKTL